MYGGLEDDLVVNGYTDASFQSDKDDFRLQSEYDPLTKPLPQAKHDRHARFIGIRYIDEWA